MTMQNKLASDFNFNGRIYARDELSVRDGCLENPNSE